jgi:MFS family permease
MAERSRTELTYRYERWRALSSGILETAATTFLLLIAVRWFEAGATSKALVAGGGSFGLLISPWLVSYVENRGWPTSMAASRLAAVGAISLLLPALIPVLPLFIAASVIGMASSAASIPLLTQIYQENYPERERGRRFSRTLMIRIATAALFSHLAGSALTAHLEYFRVLLLIFSAAFAFASYCLWHCPSRPLVASGGKHPFRALRFAREDALFRRTLISWMLMGFGNLMMFPLRVEYLANPDYGMELTAVTIALLTGVIPNLARLVLSPIWGWLFDHMNFFMLRFTLNIGFAAGILAFFTSQEMNGLILGAVIFGVSNAGGDVAWSLWVTKFAPPNRVADYMSVHTFFTGLRGVLAPLVAFHLAAQVSLFLLAVISVGLILAAALMLVPEFRLGRAARPGSALVEEVSD